MTPSRKALLIGINYYGQPCQLSGCIQDALNMKQFYATRMCVTDITLLHDAPGSTHLATKSSILAALDSLLSSAVEGDILYLHYSGHGTTRAGCVTEATTDAAIVPSDFQTAGFLYEADIQLSICDKVKAGVTLFAIFDCCFGEAIFNLKYVFYNKNYTEWNTRPTNSTVNAGCITVISGCKYNETSGEGSLPGDTGNEFQGGLTWAVLEQLEKNYMYGITLSSFVKELQRLLKSEGYPQNPQIESGTLLDKNIPVGRVMGAPI